MKEMQKTCHGEGPCRSNATKSPENQRIELFSGGNVPICRVDGGRGGAGRFGPVVSL